VAGLWATRGGSHAGITVGTDKTGMSAVSNPSSPGRSHPASPTWHGQTNPYDDGTSRSQFEVNRTALLGKCCGKLQVEGLP